MNRILLLFTLLFLLNSLKASEFTEKQRAIIYNEAIKLLASYQDANNRLADAVVDLDEANKLNQVIIEQFVNRKAAVLNDLDPAQKMSEFFELETYMTNLLLWYPDGMKITLDFQNLKAGNIISHGNDIFTVDLMTTKTNNGNYLNRQKNELVSNLLYRVAFFQEGNNFVNFKIAGVRSTTSKANSGSNNNLAEVKSVEFSDKDMMLIKDQSKALINDYINFLNLMADPNETAEDKGYYRISFMSLFKDTTLRVANDIEPEPQDRWVSVSDYQEKFMTSYPDGVRNLGVNLDSAEYGKVIPEGNEHFYINGYIDKYFSGKFQSKTVYRDNSRYDFKISFERDDNTFKNFRLASIDKFGVNLYSAESDQASNEIPTLAIEPISRKGLLYGLEFGFGKTLYSDPNLTNSEVLKWSVENKPQFSIKFQGTWYYNGYIGFNGGLGYSHASVFTSLQGDYENNTVFVDGIGNHYTAVTASVDSTLNFNYIDIPLTVIFHSNPSPEKWNVFAEIGINTGISVNSNYQLHGEYKTSGNYILNNGGTIENVDDPTLGYVDQTLNEEPQKADIKPINISLITAIGATYPLDYFTTLFAGFQYNKGLSNLSKSDSYTDYLGNVTMAEKRSLSGFGLKFGIRYKF